MRLIVFLSVDFLYFKNPISTCRFGHILPSYQTLQLGAALGLTRFAIMLGILQHPLHMAAELPEDIVKRQVWYSRSATYFDQHYEKICYFFAYAKTKTQIGCTVTVQLISVFVFTTQVGKSLLFLNPKFQIDKPLSIFCNYTAWFKLDLVGNLTTRFILLFS